MKDKNTTLTKLNITEKHQLYDLAKSLNVATNYDHNEYDYDLKDSIMSYGVICNHNNGFLCEHRLRWILDFIENRYL